MPLVSSLLGPWRDSGRRATPSLGGSGECGPTLRQCLSFADPRNQAVRAVASRRVPGARSCQGACGLCSPVQKARPGGCLPRAPSAQPQQSWQPWPHPQGEGLDAIGCPGLWRPRPSLAWQMAQHCTLIGAYLLRSLTPPFPLQLRVCSPKEVERGSVCLCPVVKSQPEDGD